MSTTLKIQTLNMWHHPIEYQRRMEALIKRIKIDTPDVLCLQEVTFPDNGDETSAEIIAKETGLHVAVQRAQINSARTDGFNTGNAILTRLPLTSPHYKHFGESSGYRTENPQTESSGYIPLLTNVKRTVQSSAVYSWLKTPSGNELLIICAHLSWGVFNEYQRLQEAIDINSLANSLTRNKPDAIAVFGGSLNTIPDADTIRFLTGKKALEGHENYWIDAWEHCNPDDEAGETQTPRNVWSKYMASENGTRDTNKLPKRRIDGIFIRNWVFGQTGSPISSKIVFNEPLGGGGNYSDATVSDHFGVETIIYDFPA